jgi:hypothetical protein
VVVPAEESMVSGTEWRFECDLATRHTGLKLVDNLPTLARGIVAVQVTAPPQRSGSRIALKCDCAGKRYAYPNWRIASQHRSAPRPRSNRRSTLLRGRRTTRP